MFSLNKKKIDIQPQDKVILKPLFGIHPGVYLAVFYLVILLGLLFLVLIYPGMVKRGSLYTIQTEPSGAAIRVDEVYQGTSPCTIFIPEGKRTITAVMPGFNSEEITETVRSRLFASKLVPVHKTVILDLKAVDYLLPVIEAAKAYAAWTFAGEPSATYQVPLILSEGMYRGSFAAARAGMKEDLRNLLAGSARFASTSLALRDLSRSVFFLESAGQAPSSVSVLSAVQNALSYLSDNPGAALWLESALPSAHGQALTGSDWYKVSLDKVQKIKSNSRDETVRLGNRITIGPLRFRQISLSDREIFYMAEEEVSQEAWDSFIAEHPEWSKDQMDQLISKGLVGPDYLQKPDNPFYPGNAVPGISHYAAEAFCKWLDAKVPTALQKIEGATLKVRLPTEAEWYIAASHFGNKEFDSIIGGLWEWCSDPFVPYPELSAPEKIKNMIGSSEYVVKGGSWANTVQSIQAETRASLPPDSSTPFVGFRPVFAVEVSHE